jgi:hypothetical protein
MAEACGIPAPDIRLALNFFARVCRWSKRPTGLTERRVPGEGKRHRTQGGKSVSLDEVERIGI